MRSSAAVTLSQTQISYKQGPRFVQDRGGFIGAEKALTVCFALLIVLNLGRSMYHGVGTAASDAKQALATGGLSGLGDLPRPAPIQAVSGLQRPGDLAITRPIIHPPPWHPVHRDPLPMAWCDARRARSQSPNWTADWMAEVPDSTRLSDLSLPGTHDTMTYQVNNLDGASWLKTQNLSLEEQLKAGVRVLDIRVRCQGTPLPDDSPPLPGPDDAPHAPHLPRYDPQGEQNLWLVHDSYGIGGTLEDVLDTVQKFQAEHPREAIVMRLSKDDTSVGCRQSVPQVFDSYMDRYTKQGLRVWTGTDNNPTLEKLRGNLVVLHDMGDGNSKYAPKGYGSSFAHIADNWAPGTKEEKWKDVDSNLEAAEAPCPPPPAGAAGSSAPEDTCKPYLTFLSAAKGEEGTPHSWSEEMNGKAIDKLRAVCSGHFGMVLADFTTPEMTQAVIRGNCPTSTRCPPRPRPNRGGWPEVRF